MKSIEQVRVLGPTRERTQVELSRTDGMTVGLALPLRDSGDLDGTPGVVLSGPKGTVVLDEGTIRASRHIHCSPAEAGRLGISSGDRISVRIPGPLEVTLGNVLVRVNEKSKLEMHLDTDEGNAADVRCGDFAYVYWRKEK